MNQHKTVDEIRSLNVLVVDDEIGFRDLLKWELESKGMIVETAKNGSEGVKLAKNKKFDVIVTDVTMPEMDGLKLMESIKKVSPETEVIIVTGFGAVETAVYAMQNGACDFLLKPYDVQYLLNCIKKVAQTASHCPTCRRKSK